MNKMWAKLREGKPALGTMLKCGPQIVDYVGQAEFDFIIPDLMFTAIDWTELYHMTHAAHANGMGCITRLQSYPFTGARADDRIVVDASRALSLKVDGVTFAVRNADEGRQCADLTKNWHRGHAPASPDYVKKIEEDVADTTLIMPSLESKLSIENSDEIIDVPGLTGLFLAMHDFTKSLGYPQQVEHPEVLKVVEKIVTRARNRGLVVMANTGFFWPEHDLNAQRIKRMADVGIQLIMVQVVETIVYTTLHEIKKRVEGLDARVKSFDQKRMVGAHGS